MLSKNPGVGIKLKLSDGQMGEVALCDLSDEYSDRPTDAYTDRQCVRCYMLQRGDTLKVPILSARKSR